MLGMGQSIGVSVAIQNGLGKYQDLLNTTQLQSVDKALYANDLLYILSLSLSKISVLELLQGLAVVDKHKTIAKWTSYFVGIWTLAIIIPPLFRCSLPQVWNSQSNNCINMVSELNSLIQSKSDKSILTTLLGGLLDLYGSCRYPDRIGPTGTAYCHDERCTS